MPHDAFSALLLLRLPYLSFYEHLPFLRYLNVAVGLNCYALNGHVEIVIIENERCAVLVGYLYDSAIVNGHKLALVGLAYFLALLEHALADEEFMTYKLLILKLAENTVQRLEKLNDPELRQDYIGIPTGINRLDRMITGLNKSDLIILGARPGMGKTSFALNIARHVAIKEKKRVCFFSLEMSRDQLAQRLLSSEACIKSEQLRTGKLVNDEWTRLIQATEVLSKAELYVDESTGVTVQDMESKIRRLGNVDLVMIDYLGLMELPKDSASKGENRVQEVSVITRNLKIMAKELKVPVIACAQLSRGTEVKGKSHKPQLSDLRESGSIEQDADIVLFLYREKYYDTEENIDDPEQVSDPNKAECIVAKNRHGECKTIPLHWDGQFTRFTAPTNIYDNQ